ncbi:hypothetical protein I305_06653 [Cryptococcus gattii E566]|uniref:Uncharacterized protein n=1 Tax=Cryptococcus gattii EJB2 TaxID=1296103 RepID=A0ABR5BKU5_9TREE|nr:hypothetical protein I306_06852 [Cryptococcus gattii EJB2]KIY30903.1 hypothetical protein I305_06653 [Cryptococcus gattii E566]KJE01918.1 hypothetical protein I311_04425 [Cryptococcus gattii NT-10]
MEDIQSQPEYFARAVATSMKTARTILDMAKNAPNATVKWIKPDERPVGWDLTSKTKKKD